MNLTTLKRGKPINTQSREIIHNVYLYFLYEANRFKRKDNGYFKKVHERVSNACGVSLRFLHKLLKEKSEMGEKGNFKTTKKGRPKKVFRLELGAYDYCVIRNTIYDFHLRYKELCTMNSLKEKLVPKIGFKGCPDTLRNILKDMGFKFMKTDKKNGWFLAEKSEVRLKRINYIKEIQNLRASGRNIVYTIESYISIGPKLQFDEDHKIVPGEGASTSSKKGEKQLTPKGQRIYIMHAGNEEGFLPGALLLGFCPDHETNYCKVVNDVFEKWIRSYLIPVLPKNSVLVIDNTPHHNQPFYIPPSPNATKQQMTAWLLHHNFCFDTAYTKPELYSIIKSNKGNLTEFVIDRLLKQHGHSVVRLPLFHPDFNPMAHIWSQIKPNVKIKDTNVSVSTAKSLIMEKFSQIGSNAWKASCRQAIECEDEYHNFENEFDTHTDSAECFIDEASSSESEDSDAVGLDLNEDSD